MKKILIVCFDFYPINSPRAHRATELAKEFAYAGNKVTVITPRNEPYHEDFEKINNIIIKDLGKSKWKEFYLGASKYVNLISRVINRILRLFIEFPYLELAFKVNKALKNETDYDLLVSIASPYPIHWGVASVWNKKQKIAKTWVADCGDPYMGCTTDSFRKWFYWGWVEKWFMRKADFVTIPVESARMAYYQEFHDKIHIIPQGFKIEKTDYSEYYQVNKIPHFIYAGGFIPGIRDPHPFLEYLSTLSTDFRFLIFTNNRPLIEEYRDSLKEKMIISDFIPREDLLQKLASMDFVVNFDNNTHTALPSKLIDYALCGRPVLNITKEMDTENINRFLNGDYSGKMELFNIDNYRIENVCAAFLALIK